MIGKGGFGGPFLFAAFVALSAAMKILGILNITSDSFFDGGKYLEPAAAILHARALAQDGADIIDIGAASSRQWCLR